MSTENIQTETIPENTETPQELVDVDSQPDETETGTENLETSEETPKEKVPPKEVKPEKPKAPEKKEPTPAEKLAALEARIEKALAAQNKDAGEKTPGKAEPEKPKILPKAYFEVYDLLSQGKKVEALKVLLDNQLNSDLLVDLATAIPDEEENPAEIARREARRIWEEEKRLLEEKREEERLAKEKADQEAGQRELDTHLRRASKSLKSAIEGEKYPFISDLGLDVDNYKTRLFAFIDREGRAPDPDLIFDEIEAEHEARWRKSRFAPKATAKADKEETVTEDKPVVKAADFVPTVTNPVEKKIPEFKPPVGVYDKEEEDPGRLEMLKYDQEMRKKRDWR